MVVGENQKKSVQCYQMAPSSEIFFTLVVQLSEWETLPFFTILRMQEVIIQFLLYRVKDQEVDFKL